MKKSVNSLFFFAHIIPTIEFIEMYAPTIIKNINSKLYVIKEDKNNKNSIIELRRIKKSKNI